MKKTVLCWLMIIVLTATFSIPGYANTDVSSSTQSNDSTEITDADTEKTEQKPLRPIKVDEICESSLNVSKETIEKIGIDAKGGQVIKMYHDQLFSVIDYDSMEELLSVPTYFPATYFIYSGDAITEFYSYYQVEKEYKRETDAEYIAQCTPIIEQLISGNVIKQVARDIQVKNAYLIKGVPPLSTGKAIFYETNVGDYVYYQPSSLKEYLLPKEEFVLCMKKYYERIRIISTDGELQYGEHFVPIVPIEYDIEAKEFFLRRKNNTAMVVCIVSVGVLVGVGAVLVIVGVGKKRHKEKEVL